MMGLVLDTGFDHFQRDLYISNHWFRYIYAEEERHITVPNMDHNFLHERRQVEEQHSVS